jgi:hypothetical protein
LKEFESLELSVETLRELSDGQLSQVAGGAAQSLGQLCTHELTWYVPSNGGAWTMNCNGTLTQ